MLADLVKNLQSRFLGFDASIIDYDREELGENCCFIIGPPRSGSTFLYQLLIKEFGFCYLTNFMSIFPRYMVKIARLRGGSTFKCNSVFESNYGFIRGLSGPSEAGAVWRSWLDSPDFSDNIISLRKTVGALVQISNRPFIAKNLYNTNRVDKILQVFPKARLFYVKRPILEVAASIMMARIDVCGDFRAWWGVTPEGQPFPDSRSPYFQVLWQASSLYSLIEEKRLSYPGNIQSLCYKNLCSNPSQELSPFFQTFDGMMDVESPVRTPAQRLCAKHMYELEKEYNRSFIQRPDWAINESID